MDLYICEKPSQAADLAAVLGATKRMKGYYAHPSKNMKVTYAIGHMFELYMPDGYDPALKSWTVETLPILPTAWKYGLKKTVAAQYKVIKDLIADTKTLYISTDYDREGESIARNLIEQARYKGQIKRVCLRSLDDISIKKALSEIKDGHETVSLHYSALARSRADWMVGVNFSRLWTIMARKAGYNETLHIGRVITPTIKLVCDRDNQIKNFKPSPFYDLKTVVSVQNGQFSARWTPDASLLDSEGRLVNKTMTEQVAHQINGKVGVVTKAETKQGKESAPLPFNLTALQQYGSRKWGYTAQEVLAIAQSLYEVRKLTSYPRSSSRYIPVSQHADAPAILQALLIADNSVTGLVAGANPNKQGRAFNDAKVTAHHGIIPTQKHANINDLTEQERNIYDAIRRHYIAQFYNDAEFNHTSIEVTCEEHRFVTTGKVPTKQGWKVIFSTDNDVNEQDENEVESQQQLPPVNQGEPCRLSSPEVISKMTRAAPHFTDATLLAAMENISKYVDEEKFKKILSETAGLGTEATRGAMLENAEKKGYFKRVKKEIHATEKAFSLISILPSVITSPGMTAAWEQELQKIEDGTQSLAAFMEKIAGWVNHMITQGKNQVVNKETFADCNTAHKCDKCGGEVVRRKRKSDGTFFWVCKNEACSTFYDDKAGKPVIQAKDEPRPLCPSCSFPMLKRKFKAEGAKRASSFWGCSKFKEGCRGKMSLAEGRKALGKG